MHSLKLTYFPYNPTVPSTIAASTATANLRLMSLNTRLPTSSTTQILFGWTTEQPYFALQPAKDDNVRLAIFEPHLIAQMAWKRSRQPELCNNCVHIGNLPPTDMYLSNFATCFPMITKLSIFQLDLDDVNDNTLAINFVVCKLLDYHHLFAIPPGDCNKLVNVLIYPKNLDTIATTSINFSINILPHFEYVLYQVVQLIPPNDPTGMIPSINYPPDNVVIFQGSPLHANSNMPGLST
jgi:hypothetical protein